MWLTVPSGGRGGIFYVECDICKKKGSFFLVVVAFSSCLMISGWLFCLSVIVGSCIEITHSEKITPS